MIRTLTEMRLNGRLTMSDTGRVDTSGFVAGQDRIGTPGEMLQWSKGGEGGEGGEGGAAPLDTAWRKSSFSNGSGGNNCVEVRRSGPNTREDWILMRNSNDPQGGVLAFTRDEWSAFIAGAGAGEFNL